MTAPVFIIPARGGSKGIRRKNLQCVGGISLIGRAVRTVRTAIALLGEGRIVVDSEDEEILREARSWGAETPYVRPNVLAGDRTGSLDVLQHALTVLESDDETPVVLVQCTSPLVRAEHILEVLRTHRSDGEPAVSVVENSHPVEWTFRMSGDGVMEPLFHEYDSCRRQDLRPSYRLSGAVYASSAGDIRNGLDFVRHDHTHAVVGGFTESVDIDEAEDLLHAEAHLYLNVPDCVRVGTRKVGAGHSCFIIAEAGVNHDGCIEEAHRLIDAAADAGADAVKFQTWKTELLCCPGAPKATYQQDNDGTLDDQFAMLKRLELPYEAHAELRSHAHERKLIFLSTPDEIQSARFLVQLGVPAIKIGSGELDNLLYLRDIAGFGLPVLLSTGMGTLAETARAVDTLKACGNPPLALFHSVSAYPAEAADMNIRAIETLRNAFHTPVGLSDHSPGPEAALAAVGIGLDMWEKHITCDCTRNGPDHAASLEPDVFAEQILMVRTAEAALGKGRKEPVYAELAIREVVRKKLHFVRSLPAGHVIYKEDLVGLRALHGIGAGELHRVLGKSLKCSVKAMELVVGEELE